VEPTLKVLSPESFWLVSADGFVPPVGNNWRCALASGAVTPGSGARVRYFYLPGGRLASLSRRAQNHPRGPLLADQRPPTGCSGPGIPERALPIQAGR